jgi:hypothetical protein
MVQLADGFQFVFQLAVIVQPTANLRDLFARKADLARAPARIADGEDPQGMAFAAGTLRTPRGMADGALQQGAAKDLSGDREPVEKLLAGLDGALMCHL